MLEWLTRRTGRNKLLAQMSGGTDIGAMGEHATSPAATANGTRTHIGDAEIGRIETTATVTSAPSTNDDANGGDDPTLGGCMVSWLDSLDGSNLYVRYTVMLRFHCLPVYMLSLVSFNLFLILNWILDGSSLDGEYTKRREREIERDGIFTLKL